MASSLLACSTLNSAYYKVIAAVSGKVRTNKIDNERHQVRFGTR